MSTCESQLNRRNNCIEPKERDLRQALGTQEDIHFLNTSIDGHDDGKGDDGVKR